MDKLNVVIVGAGMYVCGRGTDGYGTIFPSIAMAQRDGFVGNIFLASTSKSSFYEFNKKVASIEEKFDCNINYKTFPNEDGNTQNSYIQAFDLIPRPACAIISTPDHLHYSMALAALERNLHVMVVKPLAPKLSQGKYLSEYAKSKNLYGSVEFHKRFDEANLLMKKHYNSGRIGKLRYITVEYSQKKRVRKAFSNWICNTNIFQYLGVHYADIIHWLTAANPVRVCASGQPKELAEDGTYDSINSMIEWKLPSGELFTSTIATNWCDPDTTSSMSDQKITVVGDKGRFQSDQKNRGLQIVDNNELEDVNPYFSQLYKDGDSRMGIYGYGPKSIYSFVEDVSNLVNGKIMLKDLEDTRPSFKSSLISTAVVEMVNLSLKLEGEWVYFDEIEEG